MHFIEQLFGLSPDGGNGSWEFVVLALLVAVTWAIGWNYASEKRGL